jgi:hypothetical protein
MLWLRKGFVHLLSLILLVSLIGGAVATSVDMSLTHPAKIENWLGQSNLYSHFLSNAINQAQKSAGGNDQSSTVSLSDTAVQQAAESAFPPSLLQQDVNTFLNSNYAWLQGKTTTPDFTIDLTSAKQNFAKQVGKYVEVYSSQLPVCTTAQLIQLQNQSVDPLSATCRPANISPATLGAQATRQLSTSGSFLSNPVITANTFHPKDKGQGQPYYQKLSKLPKLYRLTTKLPLVFAGIGIVSIPGIIFIAPRKRKGLRRVGVVFLEAGIILVAIKFAADFGFTKVEHRIFNNSDIGQLQQSLTDFAHRVESSLVKTDMLFGIAYIVLALIAFGILIKTRQKGVGAKAISNLGAGTVSAPPAANEPQVPLVLSRPSRQQPAIDIRPGTKSPAKPAAGAPAQPSKPPRPRPPRLIQ